jgi:hypothetical protein
MVWFFMCVRMHEAESEKNFVCCGWCGLEELVGNMQTPECKQTTLSTMRMMETCLTIRLNLTIYPTALPVRLSIRERFFVRYFVHDTTESTTILPCFSNNNVWTLQETRLLSDGVSPCFLIPRASTLNALGVERQGNKDQCLVDRPELLPIRPVEGY